jgi:hypothetical protein
VAGLEEPDENFYSPDDERCYDVAMARDWETRMNVDCDSQENISSEPISISSAQQQQQQQPVAVGPDANVTA